LPIEADTPPVRDSVAITTQIEPVPWIADEKRATVAQAPPGFWRASVRYGFMERPDTPRLLAQLKEHGCTIDLADVTYYVGHEAVTRRQDGEGLPRWQEELFAFMERLRFSVSSIPEGSARFATILQAT
jgi:KUP system potassium uptake protein